MFIMDRWRIAEAKQQFSEVVRRADDTPQKIYRRDRLVAVVVSPDTLAALEATGRQQPPPTLADAFSDIRSACLEERYELELPERGDRDAWVDRPVPDLLDAHIDPPPVHRRLPVDVPVDVHITAGDRRSSPRRPENRPGTVKDRGGRAPQPRGRGNCATIRGMNAQCRQGGP